MVTMCAFLLLWAHVSDWWQCFTNSLRLISSSYQSVTLRWEDKSRQLKFKLLCAWPWHTHNFYHPLSPFLSHLSLSLSDSLVSNAGIYMCTAWEEMSHCGHTKSPISPTTAPTLCVWALIKRQPDLSSGAKLTCFVQTHLKKKKKKVWNLNVY